MVLFLRSKNSFRYIPENESEQDILGFNMSKCILIRKPKVMKYVMFCNSNYTTDKETRNSVSSLVATLGGIPITCFSKTQRTVRLRSTEAEYVALSECAKEVNFITMLLE